VTPAARLSWPQRAVVTGAAHAIVCTVAGVAVSTLWRWFVRPLGAPTLSVGHAVGLAMLTSALTYAPREPSTVGAEVTGRIKRAALRLTIGAVAVWVSR